MNDHATNIVATVPNPSHLGSPGVPLARALIALLFIVSGIQKAVGFGSVAGWMASEGIPFAEWALLATLLIEIVGGAALLSGSRQRVAAWLLAAFVVAATLVFHAFWAVPADQFADQLTHFLKNAAIVGGLLLLARGAPR